MKNLPRTRFSITETMEPLRAIEPCGVQPPGVGVVAIASRCTTLPCPGRVGGASNGWGAASAGSASPSAAMNGTIRRKVFISVPLLLV